MNNDPASRGSESRWQYVLLWRYGALGLAVTGLAMLGIGASGVAGVPISLTLLPLGFAALIAGVVLPRIEGRFTAGSSGVSAELLAVHKLDSLTFTASAPALASFPDGAPPTGHADTGTEDVPAAEPIKLGDVWDALEETGFVQTQGALGKRELVGPHGRSIVLHIRELLGWAIASDDLLTQLATWGIHPIASGRYPVPEDVTPDAATGRYSAVLIRDK
jgi:hypothetical protein